MFSSPKFMCWLWTPLKFVCWLNFVEFCVSIHILFFVHWSMVMCWRCSIIDNTHCVFLNTKNWLLDFFSYNRISLGTLNVHFLLMNGLFLTSTPNNFLLSIRYAKQFHNEHKVARVSGYPMNYSYRNSFPLPFYIKIHMRTSHRCLATNYSSK